MSTKTQKGNPYLRRALLEAACGDAKDAGMGLVEIAVFVAINFLFFQSFS
jgi:hypothetical protein